jgi:hypothetical protein
MVLKFNPFENKKMIDPSILTKKSQGDPLRKRHLFDERIDQRENSNTFSNSTSLLNMDQNNLNVPLDEVTKSEQSEIQKAPQIIDPKEFNNTKVSENYRKSDGKVAESNGGPSRTALREDTNQQISNLETNQNETLKLSSIATNETSMAKTDNTRTAKNNSQINSKGINHDSKTLDQFNSLNVKSTKDLMIENSENQSLKSIRVTSGNIAENYRKSDGNIADKVTGNYRKSSGKFHQEIHDAGESSGKLPDKLADGLTENYRKCSGKLTEIYTYSSLSGLQKKITEIFYFDCRKNGSKITERWAIDDLATITGISTKSTKDAVYELTKKGIIGREKIKNGRGGWTQYSLNNSIYSEIFSNESIGKLAENYRKTDGKTDGKLPDKLAEIVSSSSSLLNIKNITTTTQTDSDEWSQIVFPDVLVEWNFGPHLTKQVRERGYLNPSEFQDSLNAFAFDIKTNDVINVKNIREPINLFMKITRDKVQYPFPSNYQSDEKIFIEEVKKRAEETKKKAEEIKKRREELERAESELVFENWFSSLTREEKNKIYPENNFYKIGTSEYRELLEAHYKLALKSGRSPNDPVSEISNAH